MPQFDQVLPGIALEVARSAQQVGQVFRQPLLQVQPDPLTVLDRIGDADGDQDRPAAAQAFALGRLADALQQIGHHIQFFAAGAAPFGHTLEEAGVTEEVQFDAVDVEFLAHLFHKVVGQFEKMLSTWLPTSGAVRRASSASAVGSFLV